MTQEDKDLLLKDLCSRLPYRVKIRIEYPFLKEEEWHSEILYGLDLQRLCIANTSIRLEEFKPYLFPLSSMTAKQKEELEDINLSFDGSVINNIIEYLGNHRQFITHFDCSALIDWLNKNHFDYRGLIDKSLALDVTGLNIY